MINDYFDGAALMARILTGEKGKLFIFSCSTVIKIVLALSVHSYAINLLLMSFQMHAIFNSTNKIYPSLFHIHQQCSLNSEWVL